MTTNPYLGPTVRVESTQPKSGRYRLRPIAVDAIQWTNGNTAEVIAWAKAHGDAAEWVEADPTSGPGSAYADPEHISIEGPDGGWLLDVDVDCYVVYGPWAPGEESGYLSMSAKLFARDYEPQVDRWVGYCGACGRGGAA